MRKTDFIRQIDRDNRKYNIVKLKSFLSMKLSVGETRKRRKFAYSIFEKPFTIANYNNGLPDNKYYKPTDIVLYDLIRKEDLERTKVGLIKLYKKCYSHKFLHGGHETERIEKSIKTLDQMLHSWNSGANMGLFDFAYDMHLDSYINYYEISFHNYSSSYVAVQMRVDLADSIVEEIGGFIKKHYEKPGMCVHRHWGKNNKKSGAKIIYGISRGAMGECAKSQIVYEQLQYIKKCYLREMIKYIPLMLYKQNKSIYGINVFETNITYEDRLEDTVYYGLGLNDMRAVYLSDAERLYFSTQTFYEKNEYESDMIFIYNPDKIEDYEMYGTSHNKALEQLSTEYMEELYRGIILKNIGIVFYDLISRYRNEVNKCKASKDNHKKLLDIQYRLYKGFYDFKKIDEELPVEKAFVNLNEILCKNAYAQKSIYYGYHPINQFVGNPQGIWNQIIKNYEEVDGDLKRKIEISDSLARFRMEQGNRALVVIQVFLAMATLYFMIFQGKAAELAAFLGNLIDFIR